MLVYNSRLQFIMAEKSRRKKLKATSHMHPQPKARRSKKLYYIQFLHHLTNNLEENSKYGGRKRQALRTYELFCSVPQVSLNTNNYTMIILKQFIYFYFKCIGALPVRQC